MMPPPCVADQGTFRHNSGMADTRVITYQGGAEPLRHLLRLLREQGVWVVYQPPQRKRGTSGIAGEFVLNMTLAGAYDDMQLAVRKLRERFPDAWVEIR
jgi:hypothetical protein